VRFLPDPRTAQKYELGSRAGIRTWALITRLFSWFLGIKSAHKYTRWYGVTAATWSSPFFSTGIKIQKRSNYLFLQIATPSPGFLYNGAIFPVEKNSLFFWFLGIKSAHKYTRWYGVTAATWSSPFFSTGFLQIATPSPGFLYNGAIFPVEKNGELQVAAVTPYQYGDLEEIARIPVLLVFRNKISSQIYPVVRSNCRIFLQIATPSPGFLYNGAIFPVEKNGELQVAAVTHCRNLEFSIFLHGEYGTIVEKARTWSGDLQKEIVCGSYSVPPGIFVS
jgi:hypothetical protein